jgi:hypothetical protein
MIKITKVTQQTWLSSLIAIAFALTISPLANASDGVVEINAASARAGGITPNDDPGFPVTISQPGSYRLTGNLGRTQGFTLPGGSPSVPHMIHVTADDVTIDMNGFRISCNQLVLIVPGGTGGPTPCSSSVSTDEGDGIRGDGDSLTVMNGTIFGSPDDGIDARGNGTLVRDVQVMMNRGHGIVVRGGSMIRDSVAAENETYGFSVGTGSTLVASTAYLNAYGVSVSSSASVLDCNIRSNTNTGLRGALSIFIPGSPPPPPATFSRCTITGNGDDIFGNLVELGDNYCQDGTC